MEFQVANTAFMAIIVAAFMYGLLKFNAWIINGFYQITRGEEKEQPDGTVISVGKILYPIKKYLDKYTVKRMLYSDANLKLLVHHIVSSTPALNNTVDQMGASMIWVNPAGWSQWIKNKESIEKRFDITLDIEFNSSGIRFINVFKHEKKHLISDWIRKPFINCVHCMASFHSIYVYWPAMLYFFGFSWMLVAIWPLYMLALVVFNIQTFKDSNI